jgi:hypothetical protein
VKTKIIGKVYTLAIEGYPAKKICSFLKKDKGEISRILKALEVSGFLVCVNARDKVKFYESTSKKLTPRSVQILSTILREKPSKLSYGGYETRVHSISFRAEVLSWKKRVHWNYTWSTNDTKHYLLKKGDNTFIRHKSKHRDTLRLVIPDMLWNVSQKGSVTHALKHKARLLMGNFATQYGVRLKEFRECPGTSYALPVRNPELVDIAQDRTVYFDKKAMLDASHGIPEFEAPLNMMVELLSLPERVSQLETDVAVIKQIIPKLTKQVDTVIKNQDTISLELKTISNQLSDMSKLFSPVNNRKDNYEDVT